jgi:hypothetical protein
MLKPKSGQCNGFVTNLGTHNRSHPQGIMRRRIEMILVHLRVVSPRCAPRNHTQNDRPALCCHRQKVSTLAVFGFARYEHGNEIQKKIRVSMYVYTT